MDPATGNAAVHRNPSRQKAGGNGCTTGRSQAHQGDRSEADTRRVAEANGAEDEGKMILCARAPALGADQAKGTKLSGLSRALS
jgi:hypothetical protein